MKRDGLYFTRLLLWLGIIFSAPALHAGAPQWIWHDNHGAKPAAGEVRYFRKRFEIKSSVSKAILSCATDAALEVYVNGQKITGVPDWGKASNVDVTEQIQPGTNVLAIRATKTSDTAALAAMVQLTYSRRLHEVLVSDASWVSSSTEVVGWTTPDFDASGWNRAVSLGSVGAKLGGNVFGSPQATPAEELTTLPGFKVELIHSAQPWEGSWVCQAVDGKGRLIISPQEGNLLRVTLDKQGQVEKIEPIDLPIGSAMGLLWAFDSLYVNGAGPMGTGVYRLHYNHQLDLFDGVTLIKNLDRAVGEHGSHALVLGPDKHIYIVSGNFTAVPPDISPASPHRNFADDQLLPRADDPNGFGAGMKPPGGFILRTDENGKNWELFCGGMRNIYDFAFNTDGEMIGFDSDAERDWGMPWYRPIRFCHLVSGGEYGFREGSGKWPKYYPDSLPGIVDVGVGSPTGLKFGAGSNFPGKYKTALYGLDWAYGRIFATHLRPKGASYEATFETLVKGKPLNVTDVEFGKDGAMYFTTGGRGTQSGLYRVTYDGPNLAPEPNAPSREELKAAAEARELRHKLESFHAKINPKAVDFAWPHLNSDDRFIRYAARIAIESQPVAQWQARALAEVHTNAGITALLALARCGGRETQAPLLQALDKFPLDNLSESQKLDELRVIEVSFIRQSHPDAEWTKLVTEKLNRHYPADDEWLNRELSRLLIYLQAPGVVARTLTLLDAAPTVEEQIHYVVQLRTLTNGWTLAQHEHYFNWFDHAMQTNHPPEMLKWFADADREYADGSVFSKFIAAFRQDAAASLTDGERRQLASVLEEKKPATPQAPAVVRKFVRDWKMSDLEPALNRVTKGRSFARGKEVFTAAQCVQCHRFANEGGSVGPELTAISSRFGHRDILESIVEPSKVVSEQYMNTVVIKKDGEDVTGRLVDENDRQLVLVTNPLNQTKVTVAKNDIQSRQPSKISPMPEGLLSTFTQNEILDLIAFLESGGKKSAAVFGKK